MPMDVKNLSPSVFAFVGDAVYGLCVRNALSQVNRPSRTLHKLSVELVNATAQTKAFHFIEPLLTEEEMDIYKRGRNFHTKKTPKSSTAADYHCATGLESLFGFLYLSENQKRVDELFSVVWENMKP